MLPPGRFLSSKFAQNPTREAYSALPDPLAGFQQLLHGREGEGKEGGTFPHFFFTV